MKKNLLSLLATIIYCSTIYCQSPNSLKYYGYWDQNKYIDANSSDNFIRANSGFIVKRTAFKELPTSTYARNLLYPLIYNFGWDSDLDIDERPDIENPKIWDSILNRVAQGIGNRDSLILGFCLVDEPLGAGVSQQEWVSWQKKKWNFNHANFALSGNFTGSHHDDIAVVYRNHDNDKTIINPSIGNKISASTLTFRTDLHTSYNFKNVKFVVAGNFDGESYDDLVSVYRYSSGYRIHMRPSNGSSFHSTYTWFDDANYNFDDVVSIVSGDYNNDGKDDLALLHRDDNNSRIDILMSNGSKFILDQSMSRFSRNNSSYNMQNVKHTLSGDFNGDGYDDLALFYSYQNSSQINIFLNNTVNGFDNSVKSWYYKTILHTDFAHFDNVPFAVSGDFNNDKCEDIAFLFDDKDSGYQKVYRYLSKPNNTIDTDKFEYVGKWRYDYNSNGYFDNVNFVLCGDFAEVKFDRVNYKNLDDIVYLRDVNANKNNITGFLTKPGIAFSNKKVIEDLSAAVKNKFGDKITMVNYTVSSSSIPNVIANNLDWIGVDPYPFGTKKGLNQASSYKFILNALNNVKAQQPNSKICLIGQSYSRNNYRRYPTLQETEWYYNIAHDPKNNIECLLWYRYYSMGSISGANEVDSLLDKHAEIGRAIVDDVYSYATIPYSTGFEYGIDLSWKLKSSNLYGRIQTSLDHAPYEGVSHLISNASEGGYYCTNETWLHLDLANENDVYLSFYLHNHAEEIDTEDGIFFSDNGGVSFQKVHPLEGGSGYSHIELDIDQLAHSNGLVLNNTFVIKFQQRDNFEFPTDGFALDDVNVKTGNVPKRE